MKKDLFLYSISFLLSGCSLFSDSFEPFTSPAIVPPATQESNPSQDKPLTEVSVQELPARDNTKIDSISLRWLAPEEPLDYYIIRYGFSATSLDYEERVNWSVLKSENHQEYGKVLIHELTGLPDDKIVYLSIAGAKNDNLSKATAIFSVHPVKK